jgi:hypothetical protein
LKYETDFENIIQTSPYTLSMPISHSFNLGAVSGGARIWMDDGSSETNSPTPHSGSRCVGMETTTSERNEFNILDIQDLASSEYYVSVWLYFPVGWQIPASHWYSMGQPFQGQDSPWLPMSAVHPNNWGGVNSVDIDYNTPPNLVTLSHVAGYLPPVGRWFKFEFYVYMHPTQGKLKVWIDGNLMCDISNLQTVNSVGQPMLMMPAKIYGANGQGTWRLWVDDLAIYGLP